MRGQWSDLCKQRFLSQEGQDLYRDILVENGSKDETSVSLSCNESKAEKEKTHPTIWMWTRQKSRRQ